METAPVQDSASDALDALAGHPQERLLTIALRLSHHWLVRQLGMWSYGDDCDDPSAGSIVPKDAPSGGDLVFDVRLPNILAV